MHICLQLSEHRSCGLTFFLLLKPDKMDMLGGKERKTQGNLF